MIAIVLSMLILVVGATICFILSKKRQTINNPCVVLKLPATVEHPEALKTLTPNTGQTISTEFKETKPEKTYKVYVVYPEHLKVCNFTSEEWENVWWDQSEEPNTDEDDIQRYYYEFEDLFDSNDPGLINGYTTEKYLLTIYKDEDIVRKQYPLIGRMLDQKLPKYDVNINGKRHMTEEEIYNDIHWYGKN